MRPANCVERAAGNYKSPHDLSYPDTNGPFFWGKGRISSQGFGQSKIAEGYLISSRSPGF